MTNSYTKFEVNISKGGREKLENWILAKGNNSRKIYEAWPNSNLIWIMFWEFYIPNFKSISKKTRENSPENWSVTDGQTDWLTDRQTDSEQTKSTPGKPVGDLNYQFKNYSNCRYVAKHICLWNASYLTSRTDMSVMRYTGNAQAIGTQSTPAPLAQRHSDETYMDTRSERYEGCTNMAHIIWIELTNSFYLLHFVRCRISM